MRVDMSNIATTLESQSHWLLIAGNLPVVFVAN